MSPGDETCWTIVRGAAAGDVGARDTFATTYLDVVRAYLGARWRGTPHMASLEDAVQDVFVDCFREDGALQRADQKKPGNFRTFLFAVVRNVALRHEERSAKNRQLQPSTTFDPSEDLVDEERLSLVFDRAWAQALLKRAVQRQESWAAGQGERAQRRVELLRLRFSEDLPIREIAKRWGSDAAVLHREYARSREEFKRALREEVAFHHPDSRADVERECAALLALVG